LKNGRTKPEMNMSVTAENTDVEGRVGIIPKIQSFG
jgi:hypothetical protein